MENLKHYGVLGMKWGVRRNRTGTRTNGKSRYLKTKNVRNKKMSEMSDSELQQAINRLNLERQYKQLNPSSISRGKKFVHYIEDRIVLPVITDVARSTLQSEIRKELKISRR